MSALAEHAVSPFYSFIKSGGVRALIRGLGIMRRLLPLSTLLVVAAGLWAFPLHASANSSSGCENDPPDACKTVQVDSGGALTSPSTTGTVTFYGGTGGAGLSASTTYNVVDAIEGLPNHNFADGSYTLTWGTCTDGSATGATYTVVSGGSYPLTLPTTSPSPTGVTIKTGTDGGFSCAYTLAYPSGSIPTGSVSVKNDFWVVNVSGTRATQTASESVKPGVGPPVPEVPLAILIPAGMLLLGAGYILIRRRQTPATAS
jgi:hypothetical protein